MRATSCASSGPRSCRPTGGSPRDRDRRFRSGQSRAAARTATGSPTGRWARRGRVVGASDERVVKVARRVLEERGRHADAHSACAARRPQLPRGAPSASGRATAQPGVGGGDRRWKLSRVADDDELRRARRRQRSDERGLRRLRALVEHHQREVGGARFDELMRSDAARDHHARAAEHQLAHLLAHVWRSRHLAAERACGASDALRACARSSRTSGCCSASAVTVRCRTEGATAAGRPRAPPARPCAAAPGGARRRRRCCARPRARGGAAADAPSEDQPRSRCALAIRSAADRVLPVPGGPRTVRAAGREPTQRPRSASRSARTERRPPSRALSTAARMAPAAACSRHAVRKVRRELCGASGMDAFF